MKFRLDRRPARDRCGVTELAGGCVHDGATVGIWRPDGVELELCEACGLVWLAGGGKVGGDDRGTS